MYKVLQTVEELHEWLHDVSGEILYSRKNQQRYFTVTVYNFVRDGHNLLEVGNTLRKDLWIRELQETLGDDYDQYYDEDGNPVD